MWLQINKFQNKTIALLFLVKRKHLPKTEYIFTMPISRDTLTVTFSYDLMKTTILVLVQAYL